MKKCIVMKWIKLIKLNYFTHSKFLQWQSILHYTFYYTMQMRIGASFAVFSIVSVGFGHWLSLLLCYAFIRPAAIFVFHYSFTRQLYKSSPYSLSHFFFLLILCWSRIILFETNFRYAVPFSLPALSTCIPQIHFSLHCLAYFLFWYFILVDRSLGGSPKCSTWMDIMTR